jgi:predicted CXXCH cytochrome family protein
MQINGKFMKGAFLSAVLSVLLIAGTSIGSMDNSHCLACHGDRFIMFQGGSRLHVDPLQFSATSHNVIGCVTCHDSVTTNHPKDGSKPSRAGCQECHGSIALEYAGSLHAKNAICADCHNPHRARNMADVSGMEINAVCTRCHNRPNTVKNHEKWLSQTTLHLDSLPCITCHTGSKNYYINLFIERKEQKGEFRLASYDRLLLLSSGREISSLIDTDGNHVISLQELREFNWKMRHEGLRLRGMMMPEVMTHSYQILDNRWDCTFCHVSGTKVMRNSFVSFPTKTGNYNRMSVEKGAVLDFLYGTPDFYMTGATRSMVLSLVGALIILCGLFMPLGHGFLRFLTRSKRKHESHHPAHEIIVYMQPIVIRIWHWVHAFCIITLCVTGIQIRFPEAVNLFGSYKATIVLHNTAGIVVAASMVYWLFYYTVIAHSIGKVYFPTGEDIRHGLLRQVVYYFYYYFRGKPNPFHATPVNKFNALQKMAYLVIMLIFMPLVIVSGILLLDIHPMRAMFFIAGGIKLVDGIHFLAGCSLCAFLFTHFYLTTLGPTPFSEIRTMWTGYETEEEGEEEEEEPALPPRPIQGNR